MSVYSEEIERLPMLRAPLPFCSQKVSSGSEYHHHLPEIAMVSIVFTLNMLGYFVC